MSSINSDILLVSPCGFDIKRIVKEKYLVNKVIGKKNYPAVFLVDGNSYMTRPGPRIIDGIEILAEILYPKLFKRMHTRKDWQEF